MNKTKRKIFETSMKLFAEKGYDATSIEEITAVVGVAKGTLYYHFSSKEEIFNFLVEEGMKLLRNSIEIKTSKCETTLDELKAVSLIQLKTIYKYENILTIVLSQALGNEKRNVFCKEKIIEYITVIENILKEGFQKKDIKICDPALLASEMFSLTYATLIYRRKLNIEAIDIQAIYKEYENLFPDNERKSYRLIKKVYNKGISKIIKIVDDSKFIGFMIANKIENVNYLQLDYFAILHEYQNKGYGTKAINLLKEQCKDYNGIYIEVERVRNDNTDEDKIRAKRVKFYEDIGFYKLSIDINLFFVEYSLREKSEKIL